MIRNFSYVGQPEFQGMGSRIGSSPDEIHANFSSVIESNFQYGTEHILNNLSERELQDLAKLYTSNTQGKAQPLLKLFAQNLSDQTLVRIAKAFGTESVRTAVNSYANPNVQSAFKDALIYSAQALPALSARISSACWLDRQPVCLRQHACDLHADRAGPTYAE